jgi:hypothetical protein
MSAIRDTYLGVKLDFSSPDARANSEQIILLLAAVIARQNVAQLKDHPNTPRLYDSGVIYAPPDQLDGRKPLSGSQIRKLSDLLKGWGRDPETVLMMLRMAEGMEIFLDVDGLYRRGKGDCNELVPVRLAELWQAGILASPYLMTDANDRGGYTCHMVVQLPDGSTEDPSLILGMGGRARSQDRLEEIRANFIRDARDPGAGFVPKSGTFKSPYEVAA